MSKCNTNIPAWISIKALQLVSYKWNTTAWQLPHPKPFIQPFAITKQWWSNANLDSESSFHHFLFYRKASWSLQVLSNQPTSVTVFSRSTPSTSSSARAGGTRGSSSTDQCKFYPWTTCSPVRSGLPTPSSTTGRSRWPTTWRRLTSCCDWLTMARSSTPWGETLRADGFSGHWVCLSTLSC